MVSMTAMPNTPSTEPTALSTSAAILFAHKVIVYLSVCAV